MKIALIILAVIVVGIVGILTFAATKPDVFIVQRTASIKATTSGNGRSGRHSRRWIPT